MGGAGKPAKVSVKLIEKDAARVGGVGVVEEEAEEREVVEEEAEEREVVEAEPKYKLQKIKVVRMRTGVSEKGFLGGRGGRNGQVIGRRVVNPW